MNVRTKSIATVGSLACLMIVVISVAILRGPIPVGQAPGVALAVWPSEQDGENGQIVTFTVIVKNAGTIPDNYELTVEDNTGWSPTLDDDFFWNVMPGENYATTLRVSIPGEAVSGTEDNIIITVISQADSQVSVKNSCRVHVAGLWDAKMN